MSVRELLRENDERFRALAHGFSADDWSCPSLCERWTNHEVLAHLVVGLSASLRSVVGAMLASPWLVRQRERGDGTNAGGGALTGRTARRLRAVEPRATGNGPLLSVASVSRRPRHA